MRNQKQFPSGDSLLVANRAKYLVSETPEPATPRNNARNSAWRSTLKTHIHLHGLTGAARRKLSRAARSTRLHLNCWTLTRRIGALLQSGSEGGALTETALLLPVFLTLVTGIFAFSVAFSNELTLTSAVGAGAQYLQSIRTSSSDPCADTLTAITNAAPSLNASSISLTFSLNGTTVTGNSCSGDESDLVQGAPVTVSATYPCALPIYGTKFSGCQLAAKVTEYEY